MVSPHARRGSPAGRQEDPLDSTKALWRERRSIGDGRFAGLSPQGPTPSASRLRSSSCGSDAQRTTSRSAASVRRVQPRESRYSNNGTATLRVVPSAWRAALTVNG